MFKELKRILKAHEVIWYLINQEQKIQHRDKLLGNLWLLLNPTMMMIVLFFVFNEMRHIEVSFCLYLFSGLLVWDIFVKCMVGCTMCIHHRKELIHKFSMPLGIFPAAVVLHKIYDVICGMVAYAFIFIFIVLCFNHSLRVPWTMLLFPVWLAFFLMMTLGYGFILARIGVYFADIRDILDIFLRLGFFINPVFLKMDWFSPHFQIFYFIVNRFFNSNLLFII
jgi:ABC-type polysaccharide/polyol phosphate export permease